MTPEDHSEDPLPRYLVDSEPFWMQDIRLAARRVYAARLASREASAGDISPAARQPNDSQAGTD